MAASDKKDLLIGMRFKTLVKKIKADGIHFHSMSYQELIAILADNYRAEHEKYINYIKTRYL